MDFTGDRALWRQAADDQFQYGKEISYWGFSQEHHSSGEFQLTVYRNGSLTEANLPDVFAHMFAWFDVLLWETYVDATVPVHPHASQTACFFLRLRRKVEEAIMSKSSDPSSILKFWAIRAVERRSHGNKNAGAMQNSDSYSRFPINKSKWISTICKEIPYLAREVEPWLQESHLMTGKHDALSFMVNSLGFEDVIKSLPFAPGKRMPEVLALARQRGLGAASLSSMSSRSRKQIYKGLQQLTDMVDAYRGVTIPKDVQTIQWSNGFTTCLPWITGPGGELWDKEMVERMAKAPDARKPGSCLPNQCLLLEPLLDHDPPHLHDQRVREALGNGLCVLLSGQPLDGPESLSPKDMEAWRGPLKQTIEVMDAGKRAHEWSNDGGKNAPIDKRKQADQPEEVGKIHKHTTLRRFLEKPDCNECLNCLDLPDHSLTQAQPSIISRIADNITALSLTAHKPLMFIRAANIKMSRWALATHPGFVTKCHKDADGLCTWLYTHQGVKIWGVLKPAYNPKVGSKAELIDAHRTMISQYGDWTWEESSSMYSIFLAAGDLLIMPPGIWHAVYTPVSSYVTGGHFYTLESLHLTEFSRAFDHKYGVVATNAEHNTLRILCRMALALPKFQDSRALYTKPMIALRDMIIDHDAYEADAPNPTGLAEIITTEEREELKEAKDIMRRVTKCLGSHRTLDYGKNWELCGSDTLKKI